MTPDAQLNPLEETKPPKPPSTAGMTTKVVNGALWTLGGSVLPLAVSLVSTPFIIRFLGAESYGVLLLVGLIPTYFGFADFGMGLASTKFASEAYARGDSKTENEIVWTAAAVAAISTSAIALPIVVFSFPIVCALSVPEHLLKQADIALKLSSGAFLFSILSSVLNSPMFARLRMDMSALTQAGPKTLLAALTPVILYFGGGIVEATLWSAVVSVLALGIVSYFAARLFTRAVAPECECRASSSPSGVWSTPCDFRSSRGIAREFGKAGTSSRHVGRNPCLLFRSE